MGQFTPEVDVELEFDGDVIAWRCRRLKNAQMMKIAPFITADQDGNGLYRSAKLVVEVREVLLDCTAHLIGIKGAAGAPLAIADIVDEAYFVPLLSRMLNKLLTVSVLVEADAKKSDAPPPAAS